MIQILYFFFLLFFLIGDFFYIHLHYQTCCRLGKEKRLLTYLQKIYIWEKWRSPLVQKPNYETPFHRCAFTSFRVLLRDRAGLVAQRIRAHGCEPPSQGFESLIFATFFFFFGVCYNIVAITVFVQCHFSVVTHMIERYLENLLFQLVHGIWRSTLD